MFHNRQNLNLVQVGKTAPLRVSGFVTLHYLSGFFAAAYFIISVIKFCHAIPFFFKVSRRECQ